MKKLVVPLLLGLAALTAVGATFFFMSGTNSQQKAPEAAKSSKSASHDLGKKEQDKLMRDVAEAIEMLQALTDDTASLSAFLAEPLLTQTAQEIEQDSAAGRVKVRKLTDVKLVFGGFLPDNAIVTLGYRNDGYYLDKSTGEPVTEPTGADEEKLLTLRKIDDKWKIFSVVGEVNK
jgi:hypothetical protein